MSIVLPVDGYVHVARLVTAGFGSQLEFGFEAIDDLQLAIELALRSVPANDGRATIQLASDESGMMTGSVVDFDQTVLGAGDSSPWPSKALSA